jgi:hypothetical protein
LAFSSSLKYYGFIVYKGIESKGKNKFNWT